MGERKCTLTAKQHIHARLRNNEYGLWPTSTELRILHQNAAMSNPMDRILTMRVEFKKLT